MYDDSLFELAWEEFISLAQHEEPFGLFLLTLDTHHPDGYSSASCQKAIDQYPDNELRVFNVHGNEVYRQANYDNSWDGTSASNLNKGSKLPTGTYYYAIYLGMEEAVIKGFVYLRRE